MPAVTKYIFALWGEDLAESLLDPELHARLAALGLEHLQVNLDDAGVAEAKLRIATFDEPIRAVVSVWTSGDIAGVATALDEIAVSSAGWQVEERRQLEPPALADGQRADALSNFAFLRQPEGMDREHWLDRWLVHHTPVAIETQATSGYIQNIVVAPLASDTPHIDGIVEELFPTAAITDIHAFYGSNGDNDELTRRLTAMLASTGTFGAHENLELVPTSRYLFDLG